MALDRERVSAACSAEPEVVDAARSTEVARGALKRYGVRGNYVKGK